MTVMRWVERKEKENPMKRSGKRDRVAMTDQFMYCNTGMTVRRELLLDWVI
jgi:hypothetical protein